MKTMGMRDVLSSMPGGMADMIPEGEDPEEAMGQLQGMVDSMTKEERRNPDIIDMSRRRRIAAGSGTEPQDVKKFVAQFGQVRTLMRQMAKMSIFDRIKMVTGLHKAGALQPGANMLKTKVGTGHRKTPRSGPRTERRSENRTNEARKNKVAVRKSRHAPL